MSIFKDSVTNSAKIVEVWQKNINGKKEAFNRRINNPGKHPHIDRNSNIRKNEDRSYTRNTEPRKIQDIFFQTIAHITTDIKIMKQIADVEMTPI